MEGEEEVKEKGGAMIKVAGYYLTAYRREKGRGRRRRKGGVEGGGETEG